MVPVAAREHDGAGVAGCGEFSRPVARVAVAGRPAGPYGPVRVMVMTTGGDAPTAATVELLGVLAYGELSAFDRLAEDARAAPTLAGRAQLSTMAAAEIGHFRLIEDHLGRSGIAVADAMAPFVALIDSYHASTAPRSWLESLVKAYLGDGLGADFYREVAGWVDPGTGDLVQRVLADTGHSAFAEREVQAACAANPAQRDRLALWGRRLLGEAVTHAQRVVAERDELAEFIVLGSGEKGGVAGLIRTVQTAHGRRMGRLGLS